MLSTFIARREALQTIAGLGVEIVGPHHSAATMRILEFARNSRLPFSWRDEAPPGGAAPPQAGPRAPDPAPTSAHRGRRITAVTLFVVGCVFSGLCLLVLVSSWYDDQQIDAHRGQAVADVLSVSFNRTAVRFVTPNGTVNIPANGVVYPIGLAAGERVRVERACPAAVRARG